MLRRYAILEAPKRLRSGAASPSAGPRADNSSLRIYEADLSKKNVSDIERDPNVEDCGLIMPISLINPIEKQQLTSNDRLPTAWGISAVRADRSKLDGAGVTVAIVDTGIDRSHPSFLGVDIEEADFGGSGNGDEDGHGTHCAGTIFGKDAGGTRIGVARNISKAFVAKVFKNEGGGDSLAILRALNWVAEKGVNIVSMSLGFDFPGMVSRLEKQGYPKELAVSIGLEHFKDNLRMFDSMMGMIDAGKPFGRGPMVIAAAGNESQRQKDPRFRISASLPSAASRVISVAAVRDAGGTFEIADFSNGRAKVCAPGQEILSAGKGNGFAVMSGTSMACPHVAGLAALWWQKIALSKVRPNAESVGEKLLTSADPASVADFDPDDSERGFALAPE
jgi:subtilisin family serine protease